METNQGLKDLSVVLSDAEFEIISSAAAQAGMSIEQYAIFGVKETLGRRFQRREKVPCDVIQIRRKPRST